MTTKEKIIKEAVIFFNKEGFGATNLYELANRIGMSRGNLAYHFKDKDILLKAIAEQMKEQLDKERAKSQQLPSFKNLHNEVQLYYRFQQEFSFLFMDQEAFRHPFVQKMFRQMSKQTVEANRATIAFSIKLGNMKKEAIPGLYNNLAFITWMLAFYWLPQQIIRGEKSPDEGEKMIWSILTPHFTQKGIRSFIKFYGEGYFQSLGTPFEYEELDQLISF
ncbi:MAG: TetR/AcrR family transcriptional regulator [Bacteroidia bacterium]|nr:TetR/AcrR family transcriptional regulator [Bacteroidia bacterium]